MTNSALQAGSTGEVRTGGDDGPGRGVLQGELPIEVQQARDELFVDADRHGPRWPVLVRRIAPALVVLAVTLGAACWVPWRELLLHARPGVADALLVGPFLAATVVCAAAMAPLARIRVEPLLGGGLVLLGVATWLAARGELVSATVPAVLGATLTGIAAARVVRRAVWTLPLLLAAGISDAASVDGGMTRRLLEDAGGDAGVSGAHGVTAQLEPVMSVAPDVVTRLDLLVVHVPAASGTWMLGMVDVVALGMLLGLAHLYWLPLPRTGIALAGALILTLGLGVPVPVLPMLGLAWLLVHAQLIWRSTRFSLRRLTYLGG